VTIEVPNGPNRLIVVEALNGVGNVSYLAQRYFDCNGEHITLNMLMAAESIPPTFAGLSDISSITQTSMVLSWSPATDNVTPQNKIQYLIYMALSSEALSIQEFDFSSPSFTTPLGATSYTVTGLNPDTTYKYNVKAMDEVGNTDDNTVQKEATTLAPPDPNPPTFGGLESASALSSTEVGLQWSDATDDVTPSSEIVYLIYMALVSGGQDFNTSTATTAPGATDYTVSGLSPETMYCYVVRARDKAGNTDSNTIERCATTPSPPSSLSISPSSVTLVALPNPDPSDSDNVIYTIQGGIPPYNVTSSNTEIIPNPGTISASSTSLLSSLQTGTFEIDPCQDCSTTLVTLNVTDSDSGATAATVNLNIPSFTDTLAHDSICENNSTCSAGTETTTLTLTGIPPFDVTSSQPGVILDPGTSWAYTYTINAIDNSITATTNVDLISSSYCDAGPNTAQVTVIDQLDIDLQPINDGSDTSLIYGDVANYGADTAVSVEVWIDYTDNCTCPPTCGSVTLPEVLGGGTLQPVAIAHSGCSDPINYRIIVDPYNVIQESDEQNNCVSNNPTMCSLTLPSSCP
jgi:chitodextrinase